MKVFTETLFLSFTDIFIMYKKQNNNEYYSYKRFLTGKGHHLDESLTLMGLYVLFGIARDINMKEVYTTGIINIFSTLNTFKNV